MENIKTIETILDAIDYKMQIIDSYRPYNQEAIKKIWLEEQVSYVYNSEAIEGNTLTLNETYLVLKDGITIGGKPLAHLLDTVNHGNAFKYILNLVQSDFKLSQENIVDTLLNLHAIIKPSGCNELEIGNFRICEVAIGGTIYTPPSSENVERLIKKYLPECLDYEHPIIQAGAAHYYIAQIHPFSDGNGRSARLLSNLILRENGYPPFILKLEERQDYYRFLDMAHSLDNPKYFLEFFVNSCYKNTEQIFNRLESYVKCELKANGIDNLKYHRIL